MKFKGRLTYRNFIDYFSNKLEKKEKHAFEKKIMQDSFESEAFDGLSKLDAAEFEKDMTDLNSLIHARTKEKKRRIPLWFPYAASVIILLGLSSVLYYLNQYSAQDEMISAQMEDLVPKVEKSVTEPKIIKHDSKAADLMEMIEDDLEMEISDADEIIEEELMVISEDEELDDQTIPEEKIERVIPIAPIEQLTIANKKYKKTFKTAEESIQKTLEGQVAGVEVQKARRQKSAKKSYTSRLIQDDKIISGKVIDEDAMPIPGVSIVVKGTANGVVTDVDGQFKLKASDTIEDYRLVASFIGFESKEINALTDSSLLVILETNQQSMDEVVVVGYGISTSKTERGNTSWEKAKPNQFASVDKFEDYLVKELMDADFRHLNGIHKVKFTFVVEPYGALNDIKFKGKPDAILVKEIERLLFDSGDWYPAESGGDAVASKVRISLKLKFD